MHADTKPLPKSELLITIELTPEELAKYENQAAARVSQNVDIAGFRKGQAPKAFIISHIGPEAFSNEVLSVALPAAYFEAVKEKKLSVISRPTIKVLSRTPLKFEARVALLPAITLKGYNAIKIPQEEVTVTDKEIDEVVHEMRRYKATYKPLAREVRKGDRVEVDFQGFDEGGVALEKTKSVNHPLFVGGGSLIAGFEDQLIGMKVGEKKKFPVAFPKDYQYEPFRSKKINFEAEMKRGEEVILPEVDEDFVSQMMGAPKPVAEFREVLKKDLHARKGMDIRKNRENKLLETFLKEAKLDVPPVLVEEEIEYMMADLKQQVESRGLSFEAYMKKMGEEKRDLRKEYSAEGEKRIKLRLILNYLFREMKIDVTEDEMNRASVTLLSQTSEKDREGVSQNLQKKGELYLRLKNNLMLEKLFALFLGTV